MARVGIPLAVTASLLAAVGCGQPRQTTQSPAPTAIQATTTPSRIASSQLPESPDEAAGETLRRNVSQVAQHTGTTPRLVLVTAGSTPWAAASDDASTPLVAWSTIKAPLALVALQRHPSGAANTLARRALTASDNQAADALHASLGTPAVASHQLADEIASGGGGTVTVPTTRRREGFSIVGQTPWTLGNQAQWFARLPCRSEPAAHTVWRLTGQVVDEQRWGLGILPDAHVKGGWGPTTTGRWLVRQVGVVTLPAHTVDGHPVPAQTVTAAMAVEADDFASGTAVLDQLATTLARQAPQLPSGRC